METEHGQVTAEYAVGVVGAATIASFIIGPGGPVSEALRAWVEGYIEHSFLFTLPDLFSAPDWLRWPW